MEEKKECPLKRVAAELSTALADNPVRDSFLGKHHDKDCNDKCAWYVQDKCALTVLALKQV